MLTFLLSLTWKCCHLNCGNYRNVEAVFAIKFWSDDTDVVQSLEDCITWGFIVRQSVKKVRKSKCKLYQMFLLSDRVSLKKESSICDYISYVRWVWYG